MLLLQPRSEGAGANLDPQRIPGAQRSDAIPALGLGAAVGVRQHCIPGVWWGICGVLCTQRHSLGHGPSPHTCPRLAPFPGPLLGLIS